MISLLGTVGLWLLGNQLVNLAILFLYTLFMFGRGVGFGNIMTVGLNQLPTTDYADGNAIFNTVQQFTAALGISMAAAIMAAGQAHRASQVAGTINGSVHSFAVLALLTIIELVVLWHVTRKNISPANA